MSNRTPGPMCGGDSIPWCSTPGPTGQNDTADPDHSICLPDTQGPIGVSSDQYEMGGGWRSGGITANSLISAYDANVRIRNYTNEAVRMAQKITNDLEGGRIASHLDARSMAATGRNELLSQTRSRLSPGARALSRAIKEEGKSLPELIEYYANRRLAADPALMRRFGLETLDSASPSFNRGAYSRAIEALADTEDISMDIIRGAGRTNRAFTGVARFTRVAGPVAAAAGLAVSMYEVVDAPESQRMYVAGREASGFAGGIVGSVGGGLAAGWLASLACGPGAPVCAIVVSVIVVGGASYGGGVLGEAAFEHGAQNLDTTRSRDVQ